METKKPSQSADSYTIKFEAIGTNWSIKTDRLLSDDLVTKIHDRIEAFDKTYSRFRKDSLVSSISQKPGEYLFPDDATELFDFYDQLYKITGGKVTPLIGGMLEKAGYNADYSFTPVQQMKLLAWNDVVVRDRNKLEVKQAVLIDVGAAGKGYLVDAVCELLNNAGVEQYVVNASGDLRHKGTDENRVGLEDPFDVSRVIGVIDVQNKSLCASAISRRRWGNGQHHVFDPDLMEPTKDIVATWVLADTTMLADGLATALFFTDPSVLRRSFEYEFVRIHADGVVEYSGAFEGKLFQ